MDDNKSSGLSISNFRLIFPASLAVGLFIFSIFFFIVPQFKKSIMERKKEMIQQLTNSALSILDKYNSEIEGEKYTPGEARELAKKDIRFLRYGRENKDYFWIIDKQPRMVMHPYRTALEGKDLSGEVDPSGKRMFISMVELCRDSEQGFIEYMWQWKDDPAKVVPKLSYVKEFKPWGWIIGTGIYTEDVDKEIAQLAKKIILVSFIIFLFISLILFYIMNMGLKIERKRRAIENRLIKSEEKYRSLVEATTQGILIVRENKILYSNKYIHRFLGYSEKEFEKLDLHSIFPPDQAGDESEFGKFKGLIKGEAVSDPVESRFIKKDGDIKDVLLYVSKISYGEDYGDAIVVNDISSSKKIREELGESREQYRNLTDNLKIGVFRSTLGRKGKIVESNPAALNILGFRSLSDVSEIKIPDLFISTEKWANLGKNLLEQGFIKNEVIRIKRPDGDIKTLMISLVLVKGPDRDNRYYDGIVEDITERFRSEEEKNKLMAELKTSQLILEDPLINHLRGIISCSPDSPIKDAVSLMSRTGQDIIFIRNNLPEAGVLNEYIGVLTSRDLRDRVIGAGISADSPVMNIMSAPVISISRNSSIFESLILMREKKIGNLAVTDLSGKIIGSVNRDLIFNIQNNSSSLLISEIRETEFVQEVFPKYKRVPSLVRVLTDSGADSKIICSKISYIADSILKRLIDFAIDELGKPPLKFSFITMGSEGRKEQTLLTDQDNAIIYEDTENKKLKKEAETYFLELGKRVSTWLNTCGYTFCSGEIMAMNSKWNKPLSDWKKYFRNWINNSSPSDLLEVSIFFDFRIVSGESSMVDDLRSFIDSEIDINPLFLQHIARNALQYKPPIGFFGNIQLESGGEKQSTFNIKDPIQLLVNFGRIYSLKNRIRETNTQARVSHLLRTDDMTESSGREFQEIFDFLMKVRLKHQVKNIEDNRKPDNNIDPGELTEAELHMLKYIFSTINVFQKKISFDFTGSA
ncbi:MAG: DUF294 nucleotidyltransferase-like domain-containing protein [Acidobacteriota bacterium]